MPIRQKQRVAQLRLLLYDRPVHPELFEIHCDRRILKNAYEARIWITSVGHVIAFHVGDATVTELIADAEATLPDRGRLAVLRLRGEKDHEVENARGIRHLMSVQVETMSPRLYERTHGDMVEQSGKSGLFLPFPSRADDGEVVPFAYIDYEAKAKHLHVFAYHAFPEELTFIKTQSIFELT